jgi:HPt (histidine-containing phosphotransfer) domain-containing protein
MKGLLEYKSLKLELLNDEELQRVAHTIKGLSGSIGALKLQEKAEEIESTLNKDLFSEFYDLLNAVILEIEEKVEFKSAKVKTISKTDEEILFGELKNALASKKVKIIKPILQEIEGVELSKANQELFENIKKLTKKFKYKDAFALMEG